MSDRLLLRMLRRLCSLELESVDQFMDAELLDRNTGQPDRDLSVFDVDDSAPMVVRVRAEFNSSFRSPPGEEETVSFHASMDDLQIKESAGGTRFSFTKNQHRSLFFTDDGELRAAASRVFAEWSNRVRFAGAEAIRSYARERIEAKDPEWIDLCADKKKRKWKTWALDGHAQSELPFDTSKPVIDRTVGEQNLPDGPSTGDGSTEHKGPKNSDGPMDPTSDAPRPP